MTCGAVANCVYLLVVSHSVFIMHSASGDDSLSAEVVRELLARAKEAARCAYAPFSNLRVGAAVLGDDGRVFAGANVENSSYSLTICAERAAIFHAVSEGVQNFRAVAVVCDRDSPCAPCGACRQVLYEFSPSMVVITGSPDSYQCDSLADLLPMGFRLERDPE